MKCVAAVVVLCASAHASFREELDLAQARALLLEVAGVVRVATTGADEYAGQLERPAFPGARWRRLAQRPVETRFAPLVGFDALVEAPVADPPEVFRAWSITLGTSSWPAESRELVLRQVGRSRVARGQVVVALPEELRAQFASVTVQEVQSGCAMELDFVTPFELDSQPRALGFRWDLSNPIDPEGLYLQFVSRDATLPQIPLRIEAPAAPLALTPRRVRLLNDELARVAVSTASGQRLAIRKITCPPCVAVRDANDEGADVVLTFAATELARRRHTCGRIEVEVECDGEPLPVQRYCEVEHGPECVDATGRSVLQVLVAAGEHFELARRSSGGFAMVFGDRLPGLAAAHARWGLEPLATLQAPAEPGAFERVVQLGDTSVLVLGRVVEISERRSAAWHQHCAQ